MMRIHAALLSMAAVVLFALAAPGATPGLINYQGLLLDDIGDPVTGNVELVFTIFDADAGGTPLWTETHLAVPVLDGVYDVLLGETTPITPAVVAGGALYLEIEVEGETLSPRQRLVAVPYAVHADTADSAASVGGFESAYFMQMLQHVDFDGGAPPNDDPSEGLADVDGDGKANFVDSDNDGDGFSDAVELSNGTDINLVTPRITGFSPEPAEASVTTTVTITGDQFGPGTTVAFGAQNPVPQNITQTSLEVDVGPQPAGTVPVQVTLANGQTNSDTFAFTNFQPIIASLAPQARSNSQTGPVTITGSGFAPGLEVSFGSENPVPQNLTPTSFDVTVGPQAPGVVSVTVSYPSGLQDTAVDAFEFFDAAGAKRVFVTSTVQNGNLGGIAGANAICAARATAGALPGTYLAWIGDGTGDPDTSFTKTSAHVLVDGVTLVSPTYADLVDGNLDHAIDQNEFGNTVASNFVWTNVTTAGTTGSNHCSGWSSTSGSGAVGWLVSDSNWTSIFTVSTCNNARRLYCFEQ